MTLEDLGNIGEILGAIGVIVSLIYLGVQIGRNATSARQQSYHNLVTRKSDWLNQLARDEELMALFIRGSGGAFS